jgi:hemin uptake protein HemP
MNPDDADSTKLPPGPSETQEPRATPEYDSADLLRGEREVRIRHADEVYRLRLTRNNKLILQK